MKRLTVALPLLLIPSCEKTVWKAPRYDELHKAEAQGVTIYRATGTAVEDAPYGQLYVKVRLYDKVERVRKQHPPINKGDSVEVAWGEMSPGMIVIKVSR